MAPSTSEQSQVHQDMLQDDHKCRGTSMERVQSGFKVKVGSRTKWCTMSQEIEEVHVCVCLQYSESLVNSQGLQKGEAWSTMQEGISDKMGKT